MEVGESSNQDIRQPVLFEDFNNCLPEAVAVYLNEREVQKLDEASVLADKFVLTHKRVPSRGWVSQHIPPKTLGWKRRLQKGSLPVLIKCNDQTLHHEAVYGTV